MLVVRRVYQGKFVTISTDMTTVEHSKQRLAEMAQIDGPLDPATPVAEGEVWVENRAVDGTLMGGTLRFTQEAAAAMLARTGMPPQLAAFYISDVYAERLVSLNIPDEFDRIAPQRRDGIGQPQPRRRRHGRRRAA